MTVLPGVIYNRGHLYIIVQGGITPDFIRPAFFVLDSLDYIRVLIALVFCLLILWNKSMYMCSN